MSDIELAESTQLDEIESIPNSSNLAGTTDDDAPAVLFEETSTLDGEERSGIR